MSGVSHPHTSTAPEISRFTVSVVLFRVFVSCRSEPFRCARTLGAAATLRLNSREPEALWCRRNGRWSTELRRATQVRFELRPTNKTKLHIPLLFLTLTNLFHPSTVDQNEETLKRSSVEKPLSIMDYYQHDVFSHLEKDSRRISQYNLLHKESSLDGKAGDRLSVSIKTAPQAFYRSSRRLLIFNSRC